MSRPWLGVIVQNPATHPLDKPPVNPGTPRQEVLPGPPGEAAWA